MTMKNSPVSHWMVCCIRASPLPQFVMHFPHHPVTQRPCPCSLSNWVKCSITWPNYMRTLQLFTIKNPTDRISQSRLWRKYSWCNSLGLCELDQQFCWSLHGNLGQSANKRVPKDNTPDVIHWVSVSKTDGVVGSWQSWFNNWQKGSNTSFHSCYCNDKSFKP
jgi:hypothetical protein